MSGADPTRVETGADGEFRLAALARLPLTEGGHLDEVLDRIARVAARLLPAPAGATVVLWDEDADRFAIASSTAEVQRGEAPQAGPRRRSGAARWVIEHLQPVIVSDVRSQPFPPNRMVREHGVKAYIGVPIVNAGKPLGVLFALDDDYRQYSEADVQFMETLAIRAAAAIVNTRLVAELQEARNRATLVGDMSRELLGAKTLRELLQTAADGIVSVLSADLVLVITLDMAQRMVTDHIMSGPIDVDAPDDFDALMQGLTGWAIERGATAISPGGVPDPRESERVRVRRERRGLGPIVVVPLVAEGRTLGTMTAIRRLGRPDFVADEVHLLEAIAGQSSVAIENARLDEATRQALAEVETLLRMSRTLGGTGSLREMLQEVVDTVAAELPADRVSLFGIDVEAGRVAYAVGGGRGRHRSVLDVGFDELMEGLTGWVMRYQRPALSLKGRADERESARVRDRRRDTEAGSVIVAPVSHRGRPLGTLTAINAADGPDFRPRDVDFLEAIAVQAAIAIHDAQLLEEVRRLAITDTLTGIYSRGHLFELGEQEVRAAARYRRPLAALMIDVDHFKNINDTHGHGAGDRVLAEVVRRCRNVLRDSDVFGRYGGEEFVVVMPETEIDGARDVAERLRAAVADRAVQAGPEALHVTISIGVSSLDTTAPSLQHLLDRADASLMTAKQRGRNQVVG